MDQIQSMRLFIRVVELGSFSKAAADMGLGQPAATKRIAQLEERLGVRLLHRSTQGVTLINLDAGTYLAGIEKVLESDEDAGTGNGNGEANGDENGKGEGKGDSEGE